jgi:hypothetical protein
MATEAAFSQLPGSEVGVGKQEEKILPECLWSRHNADGTQLTLPVYFPPATRF